MPEEVRAEKDYKDVFVVCMILFMKVIMARIYSLSQQKMKQLKC